jgi:M penetrans paralogue family 26
MEEQKNLLTPNYSQQSALPNATAALVLGIISILGGLCYGIVGLICGIIGLVLANKDKKMYHSSPDLYSATSYSTSNSGRVCSIIGLILGCLWILFYIIFFIFFGALFTEAIRQGGRY